MKKQLLSIISMVVIISVLFSGCKIKTPDKYYNEDSSKKEPNSSKSMEVTIAIKCDTILRNMDKLDKNLVDIIPNDGIILNKTTVKANDSDTAYLALVKVAKENSLVLNTIASDDSAYIAGINGIKEYSCGELSGWKYRVNGEFLGVACGGYELKNGDEIEFLYTCDLGKDLE